jgi:hypothetical protein
MRYRLRTVLAAAAMLAAGCGEDESPKAAAKKPPLASPAALEQDPYALSCGHVTDQLEWADETRRATVAIADDMRTHGLNRLQKTQSTLEEQWEIMDELAELAERVGDPEQIVDARICRLIKLSGVDTPAGWSILTFPNGTLLSYRLTPRG